MKRIIFLLNLLGVLNAVYAQSEGKTIYIDFNKKSETQNNYTLYHQENSIKINEILIPLSKKKPFIAFSCRIEGENIGENDVELSLSYSLDKSFIKKQIPAFHEGNHDSQTWVSELVFLEENIESISLDIKSKSSSTILKSGYIRFFSPDNSPITNIESQNGSLAGCEIPPSVSRATWGASLGLTSNIYSGSPSFTTVTHLIVHHSATANTSANWAASVASIFDFHTKTNGWSDIGYNYLIAPDGTLFVGRGGGNNVIGAHMCGYNANTMGVCMLGTYTSIAPPKAAMDKLAALLAWKSVDSKIDPAGNGTIRSHTGNMLTISGHRDGCAPNYTECPGDMTYAALPTLRTDVKTMVTACLSKIQDFSDVNRFDISPNPNTGQFTLTVELNKLQDFEIEILDILGKVVYQQHISTQSANITIDLKNIVQGIYYCSLKKENQRRIKKIVVGF